MKKTEHDPIHTLLQQWGAWIVRTRIDRSAGYPSQSPICAFGMKVSSGYGSGDGLWTTGGDAEWMKFDASVRALGDGHYLLLRKFYVHFAGHRLSDCARHSGMDKSNLRRLLGMLRDRLRDVLALEEKVLDGCVLVD